MMHILNHTHDIDDGNSIDQATCSDLEAMRRISDLTRSSNEIQKGRVVNPGMMVVGAPHELFSTIAR